MKYLVFTRVFFILILLSGNVYAVADDLITKQIVINVKQAGTLSTHIGNSKKNKITDHIFLMTNIIIAILKMTL